MITPSSGGARSGRGGRTSPALGGKYSDEWHRDHLRNPQSVVPESIMPDYPFLETSELDYENVAANLRALRRVGVPYSDAMIENAVADITTQLDPYAADYDGFQERYPNAVMRDFDGNPSQVTELDALVAYLQVLGTCGLLHL